MAAVKPLSDLEAAQISKVLPTLLKDRTTGGNIIWATDTYEQYGEEYRAKAPIQLHLITGRNAGIIQARITKARNEQADRTRKRAEVFTPVWICNLMLNHLDEEWFGRKDVFNHMDNKKWQPTEGVLVFPENRSWKTYVDSRRLEITCGEAPFLVSRYDAVTGDSIPFFRRIGALDRKLRVVNEHACDWDEWWKFTRRAFESTYGYEYQGDNLFIARVNLMLTFLDALRERWQREATEQELKEIARTISWNLWQMDGLKGTVPFGSLREAYRQLNFLEQFGIIPCTEEQPNQPCQIMNWRDKHRLTYIERKRKKATEMKFDFAIGNPPYQDSTSVNNRSGAVYPYFYDTAQKVAKKYILISPARFLFNTGLTPKEWNNKMLSDPHLKVIHYEQDAAQIFPSTDIKGGVVVMYRDSKVSFGAIEEFIPDENLRNIASRFSRDADHNLSSIIYGGRSDLKFTNTFLKAFPQSVNDRLAAIQKKHPNASRLSPNEEYELKSSTFDVLPYAFLETEPVPGSDYFKLLGLAGGKRFAKWIKREYMEPRYPNDNNIADYKVLVPESNGSGTFGEVLSSPVVAEPYESSTPTFISIGKFKTESEAMNALKYIKTKLVRALLGILKKTQHNAAANWAYIPLQDFTPASDIDWSASIADIDRQLYRKYGLSEEEIAFIETHVKEMA